MSACASSSLSTCEAGLQPSQLTRDAITRQGRVSIGRQRLRGEPEAGGASTSLPAPHYSPGFAGVAGGCPAPSLGSAAADVSPSSGEDILPAAHHPTVHFTSTLCTGRTQFITNLEITKSHNHTIAGTRKYQVHFCLRVPHKVVKIQTKIPCSSVSGRPIHPVSEPRSIEIRSVVKVFCVSFWHKFYIVGIVLF